MRATYFKSLLMTSLMTIGLLSYAGQAQADLSISYPEDEWRVELVPGLKGIEKAYCSATAIYDNRAIMTFGMMPNGRRSMVVDFQQDLFEESKSYNVHITFPSGVNGSLSAFSRNKTSLIIQGNGDDVLWGQIAKHDLFSYDVANHTALFSLEYFKFIERNLELCIERMKKIAENPDAFEQTELALDNHFDLSQIDLFKRNETSKIAEEVKETDSSLFSKNYGDRSEEAPLKPLVQETETLVLEKTDILDRLFLTLEGSEYTPDIWMSPDIPEMPDNYVEPEMNVAKSLVPDVAATAIEEVKIDPIYEANPKLPYVLNVMSENAGVKPVKDSVKEVQDKNFLRYEWMSSQNVHVLFEQIKWVAGKDFKELAQDFVDRSEQVCPAGFSAEIGDIKEANPFYVAEGKIYCLGGGLKDRYTSLAFYAGQGAFTVVAIEGAFSQVADVTQKRDKVLDTLIGVTQNKGGI